MTTSLTARAGRYLGDALRGVRQAPVEVIATLVVASSFSWALQSGAGQTAMQAWWEIAVPCALLLVVAWTGTLLQATGRWGETRRWAVTGVGAVVVGIYAWTLVDFRYEAEAWRAGLLLAAAVAWLVALPAFGGRGADREERVGRMRSVDGRFALRVIGAVLYGAALFAGLALALAAVDNLFELELQGRIYGQVWGWIAFVLVPWIVLGGLEDYVHAAARPGGPAERADARDASRPAASGSPAPASSGVTSVVYRIALWLVPPLLALYTLILYAYVIRILVTAEIPKNLVSPMVLAAGGLAALALLLFDPRPGRGGLARGLRFAPVLFLPLAPLGYWALVARIGQYGWTEFRVVRLVVLSALVVLAIGATVQLARRRAFSLHAVPLLLVVVLLLSAAGPWSALAISRRSQQGRLSRALTAVGIAPEAPTGPRASGPGMAAAPAGAAATAASGDSSRVVPASAYEQIRGSARYLAAHFGRDPLPAALVAFADAQPGRVDYAARLGLRPDSLPAREGLVIGGSLARGAPVTINGGIGYRVSWMRAPGGQDRPEGLVAPEDRSPVGVALRDGRRLELTVDNRLLTADLGPLMRALEQTADPRGPGRLQPEHALVPLADAVGARAGELVVWDLRARADSTGWRLQRLEGLAVVSGT